MLEPDVVNDGVLLSATGVRKHFGRQGAVRAVDGVDLTISHGRSVGIAGESGSGKSTMLRLLLHLQEPTDGTVHFMGVDVGRLTPVQRMAFHAGVQVVFQDPGGSFNPRQRIGSVITEPAWKTFGIRGQERRELARGMLASVDLPPEFADRFPHELSGGQRQRVAIARALSCRPKVVLLDEPVTALDISIRGAIVNLLNQKAAAGEVTYAVVSHDLTAIFHLTDYLYVMRRGLVVEEGPTAEIIAAPAHPYTQRLVAAIGDPLAGHHRSGERLADDDADEAGVELPLVQVAPGRYARVPGPRGGGPARREDEVVQQGRA